MKMRHFLVYSSDDNGSMIPNSDPLCIMSFDATDLPEEFLERCRFLREHAFGRVGHNFTATSEVTVDELDTMVTDLEKKADIMEDFLINARSVEGWS